MFGSELGSTIVGAFSPRSKRGFECTAEAPGAARQAVEERAHVTVPAESTTVELSRTVADSHDGSTQMVGSERWLPPRRADEGNDRAVIFDQSVLRPR